MSIGKQRRARPKSETLRVPWDSGFTGVALGTGNLDPEHENLEGLWAVRVLGAGGTGLGHHAILCP